MNKDKLCLVTGGAGFIGSHLVEGLLQAGYPVRVFDNFSTGLRSNLEPFAEKIEIVDADLTDGNAVQQAMKGIHFAFHLGAIASVQRGIEAPDEMHAVCATGTMHVLDAARRSGTKRVIYAASASCYGLPDGDVQSEDDAVNPLSTYAAAKLAGEMYCQAFDATYDLETVRLRFFNIFGPRQRADSPYSGVIAIFNALMTAGKQPTIHGDGLQSRDFTSVKDVVQALIKAGEADGASGNVYNVGTGKSVTVLDLVDALNGILGSSLAPIHGETRVGDVRHSRADISRIQRDLGYAPMVSFREGLQETIEWYQTQEQTE